MRGLTELKKLIFDHFDGEEIKSLSFDLGIRHDDLPGDRVSRKVERAYFGGSQASEIK